MEKVVLYKEAATDPVLASGLATLQGIDKRDLSEHFSKTADQLLIGCKVGILCKIRSRL